MYAVHYTIIIPILSPKVKQICYTFVIHFNKLGRIRKHLSLNKAFYDAVLGKFNVLKLYVKILYIKGISALFVIHLLYFPQP